MVHPQHGTTRLALALSVVLLALACGGGGEKKPSAGEIKPSLNWQSVPGASAIEAHPYRYSASASSSSTGNVSFTLATGPSGASLTGNVLTWMPSAGQVGTSQAFKMTASNGTTSADQFWTVAVASNASPVFTSAPPSTSKAGHLYAYSLAASDADGDPIQFEMVKAPQGALLDGARLTWAPLVGDAGQAAEFLVRIRDGFGGTVDQHWNVTPVPNAIPVFNGQPPSDVDFLQGHPVFDYTLDVSDADGDSITYALVQAPDGVTLNGNKLHWEPTPDQERLPQTFEVRASDGCGGVCSQVWTKAYSGVLRGKFSLTYQDAAGNAIRQTEDPDFMVKFEALIPDGSGGWLHKPGQVNTDGSFSISDIPPGGYWLCQGKTGDYIWTDRGTIDLGYLVLGQPYRPRTSGDVTYHFSLTNLSPWLYDSTLYFAVPTLGNCLSFDSMNLLQGTPTNGDTILDASTKGWAFGGYPLADASKGDEIYVAQTVKQTENGLTWTVLDRFFKSSNLTQVDGTEFKMVGAMTQAPRQTIEFHYLSNQSSTLAPYMGGATAVPYRTRWELLAVPGGLKNGLPNAWQVYDSSISPAFGIPMLTEGYATLDNSPQIDTAIQVGNPFPNAWPLAYSNKLRFSRSIQGLPGGVSFPLELSLLTVRTEPPTQQNPLAQALGPVLAPAINGLDLSVNQQGVGTTPLISWDPPALGKPTHYVITVLDASQAGNGMSPVGSFHVHERKLALLPGLLEKGHYYAVVIAAIASGGVDTAATPFWRGMPYASAQFASGLIQP